MVRSVTKAEIRTSYKGLACEMVKTLPCNLETCPLTMCKRVQQYDDAPVASGVVKPSRRDVPIIDTVKIDAMLNRNCGKK
jgi:hypothetical protein